MSYVMNADGSVCWHCDSAFMADSLRRVDSLRWAPRHTAIESFWSMTHSTLLWFVLIVVVGVFLLARSHCR